MKNLSLIVFLLLGITSCAPVKYVMINPNDSSKLIEVKKRIIYEDTYIHLQTPMFYWNRPLIYQPLLIPRSRVSTPLIRPQHQWRRPPTSQRVPRNR
jgi:hypothetical protein